MDQETLWRQYTALSSDAQRQVADFIALLTSRSRTKSSAQSVPAQNLTSESIIGMWADRDDIKDSSAWVREMRKSEWDRHRG